MSGVEHYSGDPPRPVDGDQIACTVTAFAEHESVQS